MPDPFRLDGKVAIVTGATGAIGAATVKLFLERGAKIVAVDRPGSDFSALGDVLPVEADVTDEASVQLYVARALAAFDRIDVLFNNAGIEGPVRAVQDYALDDFRKVMAVNVEGVFLGMKYVVPIMLAQGPEGLGSGSIINTSSIAGMSGAAQMTGYNASKHAVVGLTRAVAKEVADKGVRVNCVNPGPISGRMMQAIDADGGTEEAARAQFLPAKRYGTPEEVAYTVAFLASDAAIYVNGALHAVDGGLTA